MGVLSAIIFIPLIAMLAGLFLPASRLQLYKFICLLSAVLQFLLSLITFFRFKSGGYSLMLTEKLNWIDLSLGSMGKLSIKYMVGVDGLNIYLLLLSSFIFIVGIISSWNIEKNIKGYYSLYLILTCSIVGSFIALDFFLFFLFFELMLLPMYFLIGMWGGPRREYASIKFFLYTLFGSLFILIVMISLYLSVMDPVETAKALGLLQSEEFMSDELKRTIQAMLINGEIQPMDIVHSFNITHMMDVGNYIPGSVLDFNSHTLIAGIAARYLAFILIIVGFAIKLPSFPFHTWLPDAHVEAPTPISVLLAALLLKVGGYGIIRFAYGIFPDGAIHYAWWIALVGIISIIYAGMNALAMKDLKKLIAYSSVSHMGFVLLGIASVTAEGINGAMYQMFSHGILSATLFLIAGVIYDRTGDRNIDNYRGLAVKMPNYTIVVTIAFFASLGLPGFSGFIGELFVLLGAFHSETVNHFIPKWMAVIAVTGILIGAAYYLWTLQKMFFGKFWMREHEAFTSLFDLNKREYLMFVPLVLLTIVYGIFPGLLFDAVSPTISNFVNYIISTGDSIANIK